MEKEIQEGQRAIVLAALPYVGIHGWTDTALEKGALDAGWDAQAVWRLFPDGPSQAVELYSALADEVMVQRLQGQEELPSSVRAIICAAVLHRLHFLQLHKETAKKTACFLSRPSQVCRGARLLYQTVHEIWIGAGDTALDYNFYTKRALLAGVYSSTFLYWLHSSATPEKTELFLRHRIENILTLQRARPWIAAWVTQCRTILNRRAFF